MKKSTSSHQKRPYRGGGGLPFVRLESGGSTSLHEQIYLAVRESIVTGTLRPGARLASTRAIAADLMVSRFTVVTALERLTAEGYLSARRGAGTFVAGTMPERLMRTTSGELATPHLTELSPPSRLSNRGNALSSVIITGPRRDFDEPRPFRPRRPPLDVFPVKLWASLVRAQWKVSRIQHLDYGDPAGFRPLRDAIATHVSVTRGVRCTADQVIITSGAQQAFDILFRLLLDPGDEAWIEEPGYLDIRAALIAAGATVIPVPVDHHGIRVTEGELRAPKARLAVVSPSHQYPTGVTLSPERRAELLAWVHRSRGWIIEDDYDCYFRYRGRPMPAVQSDRSWSGIAESRVIYVSTFSKTMFPSLRLGFCVVPESIVGAVANARAIADRNSPIADQAALAEFIAEGHYDRHLRRMRVVCEERYESMRYHFKRRLNGVVKLRSAAAGTHVIADLSHAIVGRFPPGAAAASISHAAMEDDLVVFQLSRYCIEPPAQDALVLGYGGLTPSRIGNGVERLAAAIERRCRFTGAQ